MLVTIILLFLVYSLSVVGVPYRSRTDKKAEYFVSSLPGFYTNIGSEDKPIMFSGQLELYPENNTHYYYWKFIDSHKLAEAENRTIFWLNGGPGCSSMDGALMEAGPFRINDNKEVTYNKGSWHRLGDIVFVDQPAGTGFSYADEYDHELDQVAMQFLKFLEKYYEVFPEDLPNEIILAGESYAGQYIPYIGDAILRRNKNLKQDDHKYELKGLLIGNGWISPNEQSLSYLPYCIQAGIIDQDNSEWSKILRQHEACQNVVNGNHDPNYKELGSNSAHSSCERVLNMIMRATLNNDGPSDQQCVNMYDYTLRDSYPSCGMNWPPDLVNVVPFLRDKGVLHNLHVKNDKKWVECSGGVSRNFKASNSLPSVKLLPLILQEIPIVLFSGNRDIICNYLGTENFLKKLEWNGERGFSGNNTLYDWVYDNETVGYIKAERNLTFINIFDSSHMVPFDKPELSRSLIDVLLGNFDKRDLDNPTDTKKSAIVTYPLGTKRVGNEKPNGDGNNGLDEKEASPSASSTESVRTPEPTAEPTPDSSASEPSSSTSSPSNTSSSQADANNDVKSTSSRIARLIQLVVILVLVWGIYVLYSSYRSRPTSIIKNGSSSKKKNVQWADQLRQFQEEEMPRNERGILSRAYHKLKGDEVRGTYSPVSGQLFENIELDQDLPESHATPKPDDFVIESDDEDSNKRTNSSE